MKRLTVLLASLSLWQVSFAQPCQNTTRPAMVAHWNFNDGSTTDLINGWQGSIRGIVPSVNGQAGVPNTALHFTQGNYMRVSGHPKLDLTSYTITAIVKPVDPNFGYCQTSSVISHGKRDGNEHFSMYMSDHPFDNNCGTYNSNNFLWAGAAANIDPTIPAWNNGTNPYIAINQWYCVTLMYNGITNRMNLWVDGNHVVVNKFWANSFAHSTPYEELYIGAGKDASGALGEYLNGDIDDIRIWNNVFPCIDDVPDLCEVCEEPMPPNEIARWDFSNTPDEVLHGWTPTITGTVSYTNGRNGQPNEAIVFNGSSFLEFAHDPVLDLESWTIIATVKPYSFYSGPCQTNAILSRGTQFSSDYYSLLYFDNAFDNGNCSTVFPAKNVFAPMSTGSLPFAHSEYLSPNPYVIPNEWYCVVAMYDATKETMSLFVNGVNVFREHWPNGYLYPSTALLTIGGVSGALGSFPYFMHGAIDELVIYDGAFQCDESIPLCGSGGSGGCAGGSVVPPLIAHWNFDGNMNEQVNGWLYTAHGSLSSSPTYITGQSGTPSTALQFNGSTDYIQVNDQPLMDLESWTIQAVVKADGFYNGLCQSNAIVWHGTEFGDTHYSLLFFDQAFDNRNCQAYNPSKNVFATLPAGPTLSIPGSSHLGTSPNYITTGKWYCVTASYDGNLGIVELYVNGVLQTTYPWANHYGATPFVEDLLIGRSNYPTFPYWLNGALDDLKIYGGVFKCTDMAALCSGRFSPKPGRPSSIENKEKAKLMMQPNPALTEVIITLPDNLSDATISIYNSVGVKVKIIPANNDKVHKVDINNLPNGMYIVEVNSETFTATEKLLITK